MKVMTALFGPTDAVDRAAALKEAGASGVFTFEGPHDVFTPWCWRPRSGAWT